MFFKTKFPAVLLQFLSEVIRPRVVKDKLELFEAMEEWKERLSKLAEQWKEYLSEQVRMAIPVAMISMDLEDMVFQLGSHGKSLSW